MKGGMLTLDSCRMHMANFFWSGCSKGAIIPTMNAPTHYDFRIDAWRPDTLPMARLAEYLAKLAVLIGYKEYVHFIQVRKGSAIQEFIVDHETAPKVEVRLRLIVGANAPIEATKAQQEINRMLREDNASASLRIKKGAEIIRFPGCKTPLAEEVVIHEQGELDGEVIRVGGKDDTVPVWLRGEGGEVLYCGANRSIACELAKQLFGQMVRVAGHGRWRRTSDRVWQLEKFTIQSWQSLDQSSLVDAIESLRAIEGSEWNNMDDPQCELRRLRGE